MDLVNQYVNCYYLPPLVAVHQCAGVDCLASLEGRLLFAVPKSTCTLLQLFHHSQGLGG